MNLANGAEPIRKWNLPLWQRMALFCVAYFFCAEAGSYLSAKDGIYTSFWMPAGLAMAVLLMNPARDWPWLLLAFFPANFLFDYFHRTQLPVALLFYLANVVEYLAGAWLVRRFVVEYPRIKTLREFVGLIAFGAVFNSMMSAAIGAGALVYFGISHSFVFSWRVWWGSDVMAVLVLTPFILSWCCTPGELDKFIRSPKRIIEALFLVAGLSACLWHLLTQDKGIMSSNKSIAIPFLLWAGLRFGVKGATAACLITAAVLSFFTVHLSPDHASAFPLSSEYVFVLQTVIATAVLVSLIPAIALSERDRTTTRLRESEEKFSKAFRTSPDVMSITDLETGRYIEVNDAHEKIFGYTREQTIGHSPLELGLIINYQDRDTMLQMLKEHGQMRDLEVPARTRDGKPLTLISSAEVITLGGRRCVLRVSHDVTARKQAEEALRESERRFRSYFELASVGFVITSRERRYLAVNDEYCRILGYSREELLQKTWTDLTYPEDLKSNEDVFVQTLSGKMDAYTLNKRFVRKDGRIIQGTISARCVRKPDGTPDYFVSLLLDITEREESIEREQRARAEYTLQLIASQEAERERIAGELHDSIGQSLSIIKNHAQLLSLQKNLPTDAQAEIQTINDTTSGAIAEIRRISQDLHPYQVDHLGLTGALNALVESTAKATNINFRKKFDMADRDFSRDGATNIYRIVQEGVNNILKYSRAQNARVTLERDVHDVRLIIEDDGQGFNPKDNSNGMGLKNIAERTRILNGKLKLDSAPGKGVRIEITIPISPEPK